MGFAANVQEAQPHPEGKGARPGGILYRDGIAKLAAFSRACNDDGTPLVWLQDIAGFDIGVEAEAQGLLGYGSSLIYTNSTNTTPMFTVLLRKASGAGYYAMAGLPYDPVVQLSTVVSRLAVMEGRTLAVAAYRTKLDDDFEIASTDPAERAAIEKGMDETAERIERDMDPIASAARMDTDEVIRLSELRTWLQALAEMCYQAPGTRRIKNPRIWSIHDLEVLHAGRRAAPQEAERVESRVAAPAPEPGLRAMVSPMEGTLWHRAAPTKPAFVEIGAAVSAGETVALVEVMKTFTPVRADAVGTLVAWARHDGESVAAGDVIAWLRP
jgi:biotin carboxyl carrier protein